MFQAGDLVVYGTTGVCRVESIDQPNMTGAARNKKYYRLKPFYQDGVFIPRWITPKFPSVP